MLKATTVEVTLTRADVQDALEEFSTANLENLDVQLGDGTLTVTLKVSLDHVPGAVPVELEFRIDQILDGELRLAVTWANLPLLPGFLKEVALKRAFESLPGEYQNGLFTLDLNQVVREFPVSFQVTGVQITPEHVRVSLADFVALPIPEEVPGELVVLLVPSEEEADIPEHQDYYQKLRSKMSRFAAEKAPKWAKPLVPWVLAVPDFFALMVRLARDERVPAWAKVIAGATIAYFISPIDLIPDMIPFIGQMDDVAVALFAIEQIARRVPGALIQEHWPGDGDVLAIVKAGIERFSRLLPAKLLVTIRAQVKRD